MSWWFAAFAVAEETWTFLPSEPVWETSIGDPREPRNGIVTHLDQNRYEGLIGRTFELVRHDPGDGTLWGWGILGSGRILLEQYGASFPMLAGDWDVGLYGALASGSLAHRLLFKHRSSHLGDSLQDEVLAGGPAPIFFSREAFQYTVSFKALRGLRLLGGMGVWYNMAPENDPWFASLGWEWYSGTVPFGGHPLRGYLTGNLRWSAEAGETWGKTLQAGLQWKLEGEGTRALRLAVLYRSGKSIYGQFYRAQDDHWGLGLFFDP